MNLNQTKRKSQDKKQSNKLNSKSMKRMMKLKLKAKNNKITIYIIFSSVTINNKMVKIKIKAFQD
jgi:hypothetical protein